MIKKKNHQYALLQITFFDRDSDNERMLSTPANIYGLLTGIDIIKEYFRVQGFVAYKDFINRFNECFGNCIHCEVQHSKSDVENKYVLQSLALGEKEDVNKLYCTYVKLNKVLTTGPNAGERSLRSPFNTQKIEDSLKSIFKGS